LTDFHNTISFENLRRMANAIFLGGWGALTDSEETLLELDPILRDSVFSLVQDFKSRAVVDNATSYKEKMMVNPLGGEYEEFSEIATWYENGKTKQARMLISNQMRINHQNGPVLVQIREWTDEALKSKYSGSHRILFEKLIKEENVQEIIRECQTFLSEKGCPAEQNNVDKISKELGMLQKTITQIRKENNPSIE
jgi:hypothetical protein